MRNRESITDPHLSKICEDIEGSIRSTFNGDVKEIILYGSYAREMQDAESDLDIILLVDNDNLSYYRKKVRDTRVELSLKYDIVVSIIIKNYDHYMQNIDILPFYSNINRDGIELYGA